MKASYKEALALKIKHQKEMLQLDNQTDEAWEEIERLKVLNQKQYELIQQKMKKIAELEKQDLGWQKEALEWELMSKEEEAKRAYDAELLNQSDPRELERDSEVFDAGSSDQDVAVGSDTPMAEDKPDSDTQVKTDPKDEEKVEETKQNETKPNTETKKKPKGQKKVLKNL